MKCLEEPTQPAELKMFQLIQSQICQSRPRQRLPANPSQLQRGKLHLLHLFQRDRPSPPHLKTPRQMDLFEDKLLTKPARANHRLIGQLFDTYWLVEYDEKFTSLTNTLPMKKCSMSAS